MNKHYRMFKNMLGKLLCPLTGAIISVFVMSYCFVMLYPELWNKKELIYNRSIYDARISLEINKIVESCGEGYFLSWIIFNEQKDNTRYYFEDVIGCNGKDKNCAFSVKNLHLNAFYDKEYHRVDEDTLEFLNKMQTGMAGYYGDINYLTAKYPTIADIAQNTNKTINSIGISITKDVRSNIIYVFTLANTSNNFKCGQKETTKHLEFLSNFAGDNL